MLHHSWVWVVAALLTWLSFSSAEYDSIDGGPPPSGLGGKQPQTFIIRTRNDMKPSSFANVEQWYASTVRSVASNLDSGGGDDSNNDFDPNNQFLHVYKTVFHGFATRLTAQQADQLKSFPGVIGVFPDEVKHLQTTRSPGFLGLDAANPKGLLEESDSGNDIIIGVLDTGIDPTRRSFADDGLGPVPGRWKGECMEGEGFNKSMCNKKIIGARFFTSGYGASMGNNKSEDVESAIDTAGHGTHTASTAAGRLVKNASFYGFAAGDAVGIAPKARIAVYKVCWAQGCLNSDILAAFDSAVEDGVDVISLSVGGGSVPYQMDPIALGSFGAMEKGVVVSASAGNEGPNARTLSNVAPWITTVGASTIDRSFPADLVLEDGRAFVGASIYTGEPLPENQFYSLYYAGSKNGTETPGGGAYYAATCQAGALDPTLVRGKIVICDRGGGGRTAKGKNVRDAGGIGVVVANVAPIGEGVIADPHVIPGLDITESAGYAVKNYIATHKNARAALRFRGTKLNVRPAPVVAAFSSRGPNPLSLSILKPDVVAPGVNILAAWPNGVSPAEVPGDKRTTEFNIISGTSMSCPHVSGLSALLKGAHPEWSPAMIRSALMTTTFARDRRGYMLLDESALKPSTIWDTGAGHVDPQKALDPGLVYDLTVDDYLTYLCNANYSAENIRVIAKRPVTCPTEIGQEWDLNYPALSVVFDVSRPSIFRTTVVRTVTHVNDGAANYTVSVSRMRNAVVTVRPASLAFSKKGEKQSYEVEVRARKRMVPPGNSQTEAGSLTWTDREHYVTSPLLVTWQQPFSSESGL